MMAVMIITANTFGQNPVIVGNNNDCNASILYSIQTPVAGTTYYWTLSYPGSASGYIVDPNGENIVVNWYQNQTACDFSTLSVTATDANNVVTTATMDVYPCCNDWANFVFNNFETNQDLFLSYCTVRINGDFIMKHNVTFNNAIVIVSPNSKIKLQEENISLIVDASTIGNPGCCPDMWDGIYTNKLTQTVNIINSSIIKNAQNALFVFGGGTFLVDNATFKDNYKNIYVYNGTPTFINYPGIIRKTTFLGNSSLANHPYQGLQTYSGVEVFRTNALTIGDEAEYNCVNHFENLFCGIKTEQSYINVYNNLFSNINAVTTAPGSNPMQIYNSTAIFCTGTNGETCWGANIGGSYYKSNLFEGCYNGIYTFNQLLMVDNNLFYTTNASVFGKDLFDNSYVANNTIAGTIGGFTRTGITIANIQPRDCKYTINDNSINSINKGIMLINANSNKKNSTFVSVFNNTVFLDWYSQPEGDKPNSAIKIANCYNIFVGSNNLSIGNLFTPPLTENLYYGIDIAQTRNALILNNPFISKFGAGINVYGDCNLTQFFCNKLDNCFFGFLFNSQATISSQGFTLNGTVNTDNEWIGNYSYGNTYRRLWAYNHSLNGNTRWYVRDPPPYTYQLLNISSNPTNGFITQAIPTTYYECFALDNSMAPPITTTQREELYGKIVRDSNNYTQLEEQYKTYDKTALYRAIQQDSSILNLGDTADVMYQQFYTTEKNSNIGMVQEIETLIKQGNDSLAGVKTASMLDQKQIDYFRKLVNGIYLETYAIGIYDLSAEQIEQLLPIATNYTPWEGGDAVYIARLMLNLDENSINADYAKSPQKQLPNATALTAKLYPNPAKDEVMIEFNYAIKGSGVIEIYGFEGNIVQSSQLSANTNFIALSIKSLQNGVYFYRIIAQNEIITKDKLIIIK